MIDETTAPQPSPIAGEDALKGLGALISDLLEHSDLKPNSALRAITVNAINGALSDIHKALRAGFAAVQPVEAARRPDATPADLAVAAG